MKSAAHFIVLSAMALAFTAGAQPLLVTERDWTFHVGAQQYGLRQWRIAPGDLPRRTTVYLGRPLFSVSMRAEALSGIMVVPLGLALALGLKQRSGR